MRSDSSDMSPKNGLSNLIVQAKLSTTSRPLSNISGNSQPRTARVVSTGQLSDRKHDDHGNDFDNISMESTNIV